MFDQAILEVPEVVQLAPTSKPNFADYDKVVVAFSGGKDSVACVLTLLEQGCPKEKLELWHHEVDGREGSTLMDWRSTTAYCRRFADAFRIPLYFSWKEGGFEGEMLRENTPTGAICFEVPGGERIRVGGDSPKVGTRLQFPQVSPNLAVRWCSAYLKIDVAARALVAQERFNNSKTLFVTGERAEESRGRAGYAEQEPHRTDRRDGRLKRHVDQFRPVHKWSTAEVWDIIARWKVNPHPAYRLGWGRVSCAACIFGNKDQWASLAKVSPKTFEGIAAYESRFNKTIDRKLTVHEKAAKGCPYAGTDNTEVIAEANDSGWAGPVLLDEWVMPAGAFAELDGPC